MQNTSVSVTEFIRMAIVANWGDTRGGIVESRGFKSAGLEGYLTEGFNWIFNESDGYY